MKVGDLVHFYTTAWVFKHHEKRYRNPGMILEKDDSHRQVKYTIMWADGRITTEHNGYIKRVVSS